MSPASSAATATETWASSRPVGVLVAQRDRVVAAYGAAGIAGGPVAEVAKDGWLALAWCR